MLRRKREAEAALEEDIRQAGVEVFPLAMVAPDLKTGIQTLLQSFGIGTLRANIILVNWLEHTPQTGGEQQELIYGSHLRTAFRMGCNLVVLDARDPEWAALREVPPDARRIDVWWRGDASSRLMLLLAYLMTRTADWEGARIRFLGICCAGDSAETAEALQRTLDETRIEAEAVLVEAAGPGEVAARSADASLVLLPLRLRGNQPLGPFDGSLDELLAPLPVTALVLAAEDIDLDAEPEEGEAADAARVLDALGDAERLAELTAHDAGKAETAVSKVREELDAATEQPADSDTIDGLTAQLRELEVQAEKARRRASRMAARASTARQEARALGVLPQQEAGDSRDGE
jgi:hypothetical protein